MSLGFALLGPLAGCDLGPDYARPGAEMPVAWRASATTAAQAWPSPDWWRGFRSPELDALIALARAQNLDIAAAIARVRQADAQVRIAGAALLPTLDATATGNYQRSGTGSRRITGTSGQTLFNTAGSSSRYTDFRQYSTAGNISYEVDFWGKNAATAESARASAVFSRFDQEVVALTVVTNVATTWFTALDLQDRLAIARQNLSDAEKTLAVIRARLAAGTATALDVSQQEALVAGSARSFPICKTSSNSSSTASASWSAGRRKRSPPGRGRWRIWHSRRSIPGCPPNCWRGARMSRRRKPSSSPRMPTSRRRARRSSRRSSSLARPVIRASP